MKRTIITGFMVLYVALICAHDIHVSVCDINIEDGKVEVVLKTFLDDLQQAIGLVPGEELPEGYTSSDEMIMNYVRENLKFSDQKIGLPLVLVEMSASIEAVWITLSMEMPGSAIPANLEVSNSFLTEIYKDQTNLVNLRNGGKITSVAMNRKKKTASLLIRK